MVLLGQVRTPGCYPCSNSSPHENHWICVDGGSSAVLNEDGQSSTLPKTAELGSLWHRLIRPLCRCLYALLIFHIDITLAVRTKKYGSSIQDSSAALSASMFRKSLASNITAKAPAFVSPKRIVAPCKVENEAAHRWLEAMKNLSPPRMRRLQSDLIDDKSDIEAADINYRAWMVDHPSALDKFDKITEAAVGKRIAVFLDYDGTLSPIVEDPECAFMSDEMRNAVKEVAHLFPTAIITGRSREKVYEFVQLSELYYAGSHGMDIMGPVEGCNGFKAQGTKAWDEKGNEMVLFQPASEFMHVMNEVFKLLEKKASKIPGAKVEHNKFCISVHFRCVKEESWLALAEQVQHVLNAYPNLRLTQGRKILEIRPSIAWNKGKALDYLLRALGLISRNDVFPIYIGDDRTDEDAFKVLTRRKTGLGIIVSNNVKETNAVCSLREPDEVLEFLRHLVKWRRRRTSRLV
ncbi:hypothetical protein GOP47_0017366 [Adiantum capillus-veneris]|uniref:Trehalose 6-phosphate phosphatase n=1 Tax=Adiantum capillus-veneris TaxID=13818 RepID=A0A9D4UF62_ADICA|nr:hypothetical protein GOP47_0017366 [Adiantum capillus-veneris]